MVFATGLEGGCGRIPAQGVAKPISFISLIPLFLSHVNRPPLCRARKKEEDNSDPPSKVGGHVTPDSGAERRDTDL